MSIKNILEITENELDVINSQGNRELVHIKIMHPMPRPFLNELSPDKKIVAKRISDLLDLEYNSLTKEIIFNHKKNPFKRVYIENYYKFKEINEKMDGAEAVVYKPVKALMERGVELEITEHLGFPLLLDMVSNIAGGYFNAAKVFKEKKHLSISKLKKILSAVESNPFLNIIEEFLEGLEYFDFNAARENWIGRNINKSLKEGERGILFLGGLHSHERIYSQLENTRYVIYEQFGTYPYRQEIKGNI